MGAVLWAAAAGLIGYSSRKLRDGLEDRRIPLMAVLGAFIFAAQMVNFTIPATGSSGHLGGGLILAVLLGPYAGFLTIASVLVIQALFFADGGLLALGCNIINIGFFPCFIVYPLVYLKIAGDHRYKGMIITGSMLSAVAALQFGSLAVVTQTFLSGVSELPFATFALVMQPIHLAIGLVEGVATTAVILFVLKARPEILLGSGHEAAGSRSLSIRSLAAVFVAAAVITGAGLSVVSSRYPDGLEWSILRVSGKEEISGADSKAHRSMGTIQDKTSIFPDYALEPDDTGNGEQPAEWSPPGWSTSLSGLAGGVLTLFLTGGMWLLIKRRHTLS